MIVNIINQEPLEVDAQAARKIVEALTAGAEYIIVGGEYVKASAITGVRNTETNETIPKLQCGALLPGRLANFFDDRREGPGEGYAKFQAMKKKLMERS